jgi:hypothetical protein
MDRKTLVHHYTRGAATFIGQNNLHTFLFIFMFHCLNNNVLVEFLLGNQHSCVNIMQIVKYEEESNRVSLNVFVKDF